MQSDVEQREEAGLLDQRGGAVGEGDVARDVVGNVRGASRGADRGKEAGHQSLIRGALGAADGPEFFGFIEIGRVSGAG